MSAVTAVGINDDLSTGKTAITLRTADYKSAGGVYVDLSVFINEACGNDGLDHVFDDVSADLFEGNVFVVLSRNNDVFKTNGGVIFIFHSNLGLAIGTEICKCAVLTNLGELLCHVGCKCIAERHEICGFIASVAKHHTLVAGANVIFVVLFAVLCFEAFVNAHRNIGRLLVNAVYKCAGRSVEAIFRLVITDEIDRIANGLFYIEFCSGGNFTHNHDEVSGCGSLASNASHGILRENRVENGIRNAVAEFIGMSFCYGLAGKISFCHVSILLFHLSFLGHKKTRLRSRKRAGKFTNTHLSGFSTLLSNRLPGFTGPVPLPLLISLNTMIV